MLHRTHEGEPAYYPDRELHILMISEGPLTARIVLTTFISGRLFFLAISLHPRPLAYSLQITLVMYSSEGMSFRVHSTGVLGSIHLVVRQEGHLIGPSGLVDVQECPQEEQVNE